MISVGNNSLLRSCIFYYFGITITIHSNSEFSLKNNYEEGLTPWHFQPK